MQTNCIALLHVMALMLRSYYIGGYASSTNVCKRLQVSFDVLVANGLPPDTKLLICRNMQNRLEVRNGEFTTVLTTSFNGPQARTYKGDGTSRMYQDDFDFLIPTKEELVEEAECKVFSDLYRELGKKMIELNLEGIT